MIRFRDLCRRLRASKQGNAALLVALGAPALIGGTGFAVDTAQWYLWKRELQQAVDQAAYAGALALANEDSADLYSDRANQEFSANLSVTKEFASDLYIDIVDYAGGDDNSVLARASATRRLPFSSFLTGGPVTVSATAQASFAQGASYSACIVSLADDGAGTTIGGNASIKAQCGIAALSCSDDAITIDGSATVETDIIVACGKVDAPTDLDDKVIEDADNLVDEYADLEPPTNDANRTYNCTGKGQNKQASLLPGTYAGLVVKCTTVLSSGIYVINGGELDLSANYNVTGTGVMFVLRNGARLKLGGNGNGNSIRLSPMTAADVATAGYADQADRLSDILIFEERDNEPAEPGHIMNGNSNSLIEGLIYMPSGSLRINGTADVSSQCLLISAYRVDVRGGAKLETLCPTDEATNVGSSKAKVRLVA
ncbi:pilus assembly protein [Altererythrobacter arenosus]|uniref:Pilus assembly protein n=1 Tax=Altererythrobacter arenosus TaxID=3032592 RepID=A0ABY8FYM6_9SPHN|nr:TadE/TadG family type IV pilus assembly protein [Altererythrobacter sp. CAU 1644]WFL77104.1 pilus assembly protein [Altererythrobacter sp. CAU 1644]